MAARTPRIIPAVDETTFVTAQCRCIDNPQRVPYDPRAGWSAEMAAVRAAKELCPRCAPRNEAIR